MHGRKHLKLQTHYCIYNQNTLSKHSKSNWRILGRIQTIFRNYRPDSMVFPSHCLHSPAKMKKSSSRIYTNMQEKHQKLQKEIHFSQKCRKNKRKYAYGAYEKTWIYNRNLNTNFFLHVEERLKYS